MLKLRVIVVVPKPILPDGSIVARSTMLTNGEPTAVVSAPPVNTLKLPSPPAPRSIAARPIPTVVAETYALATEVLPLAP